MLAIFVKGTDSGGQLLTLLSVATFLYGIFIGFVMSSRHTRLNALREGLRSEDARYVSIYKLSSTFGKKIQKKIQSLIDDYLTSNIDYELPEYRLAAPKFLKLYDCWV